MSGSSNDSEETRACEVPLTEQLRSIPKDYRTVRAIQWTEDGTEIGHQFIPVGFMMHRAADEIDRLRTMSSESTERQLLIRWLRLIRDPAKGENVHPLVEETARLLGEFDQEPSRG